MQYFKNAAMCSMAGLAFVAPVISHAQASTQILYGIMDVTVRHASNSGANRGGLTNVGDGLFGGSRLSFKGTEDLGGGTRAFYVLEMGIDPSSGAVQQSTATANYGQVAAAAGRAFGRESLVGVSSDALGTLTLGRQYTLAHQAAARIQPMGNPNIDAITVLSNHHMARQDNMLKYAKDFGPVTLAGSVTLSEGNGRGSGLSAIYASGPFEAVVYGQSLWAATGGETRKIRGGGFAYRISSDWKAFLAYTARSHEVSPQRNHIASIGVNYSVTPLLTLTASYTQDRQNAFAANSTGTRKVAWMSADYYLSKRTDIYVEVDRNRIDGGYVLPAFMGTRGSQTGVTVGLRHRF